MFARSIGWSQGGKVVFSVLIGGLLVGACAPKAPKEVAPTAPMAIPALVAPVLPAARSTWYAHGEALPRDVLVRGLVEREGFSWVESLAGAAGHLALEGSPELSLLAAEWAAIQAGYPSPVVTVIQGAEPAGQYPTGLGQALRQVLRPGDELGLVRGRVGDKDRWVAIVGRPHLRVEPFARELGSGEVLKVVADRSARWTLVSPDGKVESGGLPLERRLEMEGEWWLRLETSEGNSGLPVYVGMGTPTEPLVPVLEDSLAGPVDAERRVYAQLAEIRSAFGLRAFGLDPSLRTLATRPLQDMTAGSWSEEEGVARLRSAGFVHGPVAQLACAGPSVGVCLANFLKDPRQRAALLDPELATSGLAVEVTAEGLRMMLNLAGT